MRWLLLGARGQIGSEIHRFAVARGILVVSPDRSELNIACQASVHCYFDRFYDFDFVINAAAYTNVDGAEQDAALAFRVNDEAVGYLAVCCKRHNLPLLHVSTDYVFDGSFKRPYRESDPVSPACVYGESKAAGEARLQSLWGRHLILRVSWVFGSVGKNFVKAILSRASQQMPLRVVNDQVGCPTAARHVAETIAAICIKQLESPQASSCWGIYHFSDGPPVSRYDFACEVVARAVAHGVLSGESLRLDPIPHTAYPCLANRPLYSVLCCDKIGSVFNVPMGPWSVGLDGVLPSLRVLTSDQAKGCLRE